MLDGSLLLISIHLPKYYPPGWISALELYTPTWALSSWMDLCSWSLYTYLRTILLDGSLLLISFINLISSCRCSRTWVRFHVYVCEEKFPQTLVLILTLIHFKIETKHLWDLIIGACLFNCPQYNINMKIIIFNSASDEHTLNGTNLKNNDLSIGRVWIFISVNLYPTLTAHTKKHIK
jgi:hypothetical protein